MTDLATAIHTYLTTAPTSEFNGAAVELLAHWHGDDNLLWRVSCRGQEAVVKLFLDAGQARSRRQFDGQQCYTATGIAPRPRWVDRYPIGLARQVLIYDWAPGTAIDAADGAAVEQLADAMACVHGHDPEDVLRLSPNPVNMAYLWRMMRTSFDQIDSWLATQAEQGLQRGFGRLTAAATRQIEQTLPYWESAPATPVHGDLKLAHIIRHAGSIVLVDWERFGLGDPAQEIASFLQQSRLELDEHYVERFLGRYLDSMAQPGLEQRIAVYTRLLPLRNLCTLLNGLREAREEGAMLTEEQRAFLLATTQATWQEAARQQDLTADGIEPALSSIMSSLERGETP